MEKIEKIIRQAEEELKEILENKRIDENRKR